MKSFVDGFKSYEKKLKGIMNKTRQDCEKPNQLVEKYDIKVLDSDSLYNQFSNHKEELQNTVVKVKKSNSKFENDVKRSKIRNKKKVLAKLNELKIILGQIESEVLIVDKEFKDLKAQYGKSKRIAVVRGTPAHDATVKLEKKIKIYNQLLTRYENKQNEIRKLVN